MAIKRKVHALYVFFSLFKNIKNDDMAHGIQKNVNLLELKLLTVLTELFDVLHVASAHITTFYCTFPQ